MGGQERWWVGLLGTSDNGQAFGRQGGKQIKYQCTYILDRSGGGNLARDVLGSISLVGQGEKDKAPVGTANNSGNKETIGEVMGRVVSTLKQSQHKQANLRKDSRIQAIYVGEGLPPVPPQLVKRIEQGDFIEMC